MLFEEKVVNFLRPLRGTSGKAERQLFNHKRQMNMIFNSDFEKLWVLYKTEGEPQGVSINAFCISRGVNYTEFTSTCQQKYPNFRDFFVDYVWALNQCRRDFDRSSSTRLLPKGRKNLIQLAFAPGA